MKKINLVLTVIMTVLLGSCRLDDSEIQPLPTEVEKKDGSITHSEDNNHTNCNARGTIALMDQSGEGDVE